MLREIDKMQAKNFEDRVDNYVDSLQDQYYEGYKAACEDLAKIIRQTKDLKTTRVGREKN